VDHTRVGHIRVGHIHYPTAGRRTGKREAFVQHRLVHYAGCQSRRYFVEETQLQFFSSLLFVIVLKGYEYSHVINRLWRRSRSNTGLRRCQGVDLNRNFDFKVRIIFFPLCKC
jgi:hypothetical protein